MTRQAITPFATTTRGGRVRTRIAGEFFVAGELSQRGWIATLTPESAVLAARPTGYTHVRIDVKTRTPACPYAWRLGSGVRMFGKRDFTILMNRGEDEEWPLYFIVPARKAQRLITNSQIRTKDIEEFRDRWDLLDA